MPGFFLALPAKSMPWSAFFSIVIGYLHRSHRSLSADLCIRHLSAANKPDPLVIPEVAETRSLVLARCLEPHDYVILVQQRWEIPQ